MVIVERRKPRRVRIIIDNRPADITKLKRSTMHSGRQLVKCRKKLKKTTPSNWRAHITKILGMTSPLAMRKTLGINQNSGELKTKSFCRHNKGEWLNNILLNNIYCVLLSFVNKYSVKINIFVFSWSACLRGRRYIPASGYLSWGSK